MTDRRPNLSQRLALAGSAALAAGLLATVTFGAATHDHASHGVHANAVPLTSAAAGGAASMGLLDRVTGFWTNYGHYIPRTHCLMNADGTPDWPWIITISALCMGVVAGYYRIYTFWRRSYFAEEPRDRNRKLMDLAQIFLWCAVCGYAMSIVMFVWPAYRLLAIFLVVLNVFTYRFAANLGALKVSLSAIRLKRELEESLANRAIELERLVEVRTRELEQARAEAQRAAEAKSDFLANMSHEIRTPMTAILGFTELLENPRLDATSRARHLRTVRESGRHLLAVVNDILDLARIEAGKLRVEYVDVDLHTMLQDMVTLLKPRADERGLVLALNLDPDAPRTLRTDPTRLRQILLNLTGNALKFTDAGSVIIDLRVNRDEESVDIAVIDTGMGMDESQLSKLFERFRQVNPSSQKHGGSGLGLVISRQLVALLGGTLAVESQLGAGSRFTVSLPMRIGASSPAGPAPLAGQPGVLGSSNVSGSGLSGNGLPGNGRPNGPARPDVNRSVLAGNGTFHRVLGNHDRPAVQGAATPVRVLVVDDGEDNRQLVQLLLEQEGIAVETAVDGQDAVERVLVDPAKFDLIVMDMMMPRMDGYAAAATLRGKDFDRPIVALTASTMAGDRERCLAAGCDDYISKPVDSRVLIRTLKNRLTNGRGPIHGAAAPSLHTPAVTRPASPLLDANGDPVV